MRLEPVFVVAPKATSSISTRRAFLLASGTFAVGATLGGACGYAMGSQQSADAAPTEAPPAEAPPVEPVADEPLKPSGDVELDELRRLAVKAPIEELVKTDLMFLTYFTRRYRKDEILWRGVERLGNEVLKRTDYPERRIIAMSLVQLIENGEPGLKRLMGDKAPALRSIK